MNNAAPVGFFDSGVGGLTIWFEFVSLMPNESTLYLADSKHAPYGEKSKEFIVERSIANTEFLLNKGAKTIVVACNTATTNAIQLLRNTFDVPFIGIEPAFKPAALQSKRKKVGVLATRGTLNSTLFNETYDRFGKDVETLIQVGKGLVELIENNQVQSPEMLSLLKSYIEPMLAFGVDYIVLGCTHYPMLRPMLERMVPPEVEIIDSGAAVATQTRKVLIENKLKRMQEGAQHQFFTNGNAEILSKIVKQVGYNAPPTVHRV